MQCGVVECECSVSGVMCEGVKRSVQWWSVVCEGVKVQCAVVEWWSVMCEGVKSVQWWSVMCEGVCSVQWWSVCEGVKSAVCSGGV